MRDGKFAGALVGVIALGEANLITPALHDNLPRDTDAVLIDDAAAQIIYPADRVRAAERLRLGARDRAPRRAAPAAR